MDRFSSWDDVPAHLATKTQLSKDGLKLAPGQTPVGEKVGGYGPYDLYDRGEAVPKRTMTEAQKAAALRNIQKAQDALHCIDCGRYGGTYRERLDKNGRCPSCRLRHHIAREGERAKKILEELAASDDWLIVDTETTGLGEDAEVVQIGIIDAGGNVIMDQLIRPLGEIEPEATAVHGLDAAAVSDAPTWAGIYPRVAQVMNGRKVLAYNADFDARVINQSCFLSDVSPISSKWFCIMELFAAYVGSWSRYYDHFKYYSLVAAVNMMKLHPLPHEDGRYAPHSATGDAWLTWRLVKAFAD